MPLGVLQGDIEAGSLMAGQIAGIIKDIKSVKDIIRDVMSQAEAVMDKMAALRGGARV